MKKILYADMDNVLVHFTSGIEKIPQHLKMEYNGRIDEVPGIFSLMDPIVGSFHYLKNFLKSVTLIYF